MAEIATPSRAHPTFVKAQLEPGAPKDNYALGRHGSRLLRTLWFRGTYVRRTLTIIFGWLLVVAGAILFPLPVPLGAPMLAAGVLVLARESRLIRRWIGRLRQRYPETSRWLHGWAQRRRIDSLKALEAETDPERIFQSRRSNSRSGCTDSRT